MPGSHAANDRFKRAFDEWMRGSIALAALLHGFLFAFWPSMASSDISFNNEELAAIELPPEVDIPPPPESISRPAMPVVGDATIDEDVTIAETVLNEASFSNLPPPPTSSSGADDLSAAPRFTPMEVRPRVLNTREVQSALERAYPSILRDAGVGGKVDVWLFLDVDGSILKTQLRVGSGHESLDAAAMKVAMVFKFSPAQNRDRPIQVWVSQQITFSAR